MTIVSNKRLIAIIDADYGHRSKVHKALQSFYDIKPFGDSKEALNTMAASPPALILMGSKLKPHDAPGFLIDIRARDALKNTPVILLADSEADPMIAKTKELGADGYLARPYPLSVLIHLISTLLNANIEKSWDALPDIQRDALKQSVGVFHNLADVMISGETVQFTEVKNNCQPLVHAIENNDFKGILNGVRDHDDYTYAHSMRVATLLTLLGHAAGFKNDEQLLLASGGLLHDAGKMMIPHHILNKPGRLTEDEFEIMKSHVPETIDYLKTCDNIPKAVFIIAEQHHEKIDGTGYPHGLKGTALNDLARMAAIVDVFSALTDRRVYKEPMEASKAMHIMTDEMTNHLDPHYVKMFRGVLIDTGILS
jgi:putative nucleotidyltransferase with HDIG domain